jgi:hypothetical protein
VVSTDIEIGGGFSPRAMPVRPVHAADRELALRHGKAGALIGDRFRGGLVDARPRPTAIAAIAALCSF